MRWRFRWVSDDRTVRLGLREGGEGWGVSLRVEMSNLVELKQYCSAGGGGIQGQGYFDKLPFPEGFARTQETWNEERDTDLPEHNTNIATTAALLQHSSSGGEDKGFVLSCSAPVWATNGTMFMGSLGSKKWRRQGGHGPDAGAERWRQSLTNEQMTLRAQGSLAHAGSRSLEVTPPCEGCEGTTGCGEKHPALFYVKTPARLGVELPMERVPNDGAYSSSSLAKTWSCSWLFGK
ncbi:hypothetical protein V492_04530 [Pseudogymnoascus sp. VKM F-4246]|nr:hypothetical protein V492_04530 [Pseudogymnoascus sp. VKM F-4246]